MIFPSKHWMRRCWHHHRNTFHMIRTSSVLAFSIHKESSVRGNLYNVLSPLWLWISSKNAPLPLGMSEADIRACKSFLLMTWRLHINRVTSKLPGKGNWPWNCYRNNIWRLWDSLFCSILMQEGERNIQASNIVQICRSFPNYNCNL